MRVEYLLESIHHSEIAPSGMILADCGIEDEISAPPDNPQSAIRIPQSLSSEI